jgi:hypothetical protein
MVLLIVVALERLFIPLRRVAIDFAQRRLIVGRKRGNRVVGYLPRAGHRRIGQ